MIGLQGVVHPKPLHNMARYPRPDGPMRVLHRIRQLHFLPVFKERLGIFDDIRIQRIRHNLARTITVVFDLMRVIDADQQRVHIQIIQMRGATRNLRQHIRTANHFIERTHPE